MSDEFEKFRAAFQAANDYREAWRLLSKYKAFPTHPNDWLDGIESNLPAALEKVPADVADEFRALITDQLDVCRIEMARGVDDDVKASFALLAENVHRLKENISIAKINASQDHRRSGGASTGELKRREAQRRIDTAHDIWKGLNKPERDKASIVASRMGITADTVRRWKRNGWKVDKRKADTS